jgi:hypothetical protein
MFIFARLYKNNNERNKERDRGKIAGGLLLS